MEGKSRGAIQSYTTLMKPEDNADQEHVENLMFQLAPEFERVLKPGGHFYVFFGFELYPAIFEAFTKAGMLVNPVPLVWDKGRTTSPFRGYDYSPCYEPILFGRKPPKEKRRLTRPGKTIIQVSPDSAKDKIHPFQKPLELLEYFIEQSTNTGDTVLDPFAGSATTLIACKRKARKGIGFEKNNDHYQDAQKALRQTKETT